MKKIIFTLIFVTLVSSCYPSTTIKTQSSQMKDAWVSLKFKVYRMGLDKNDILTMPELKIGKHQFNSCFPIYLTDDGYSTYSAFEGNVGLCGANITLNDKMEAKIIHDLLKENEKKIEEQYGLIIDLHEEYSLDWQDTIFRNEDYESLQKFGISQWTFRIIDKTMLKKAEADIRIEQERLEQELRERENEYLKKATEI